MNATTLTPSSLEETGMPAKGKPSGAALKRYQQMLGLAAGRDAALAENERDKSELAKLKQKLQAVNDACLARMLQPENMRWAE